jgi:phosphoketolase
MKNSQEKQDDIDKDLLEFQKIFKGYGFSEQELKGLKNHFDEMAGFLVDVWLEKKELLANTKICPANQKPKSET